MIPRSKKLFLIGIFILLSVIVFLKRPIPDYVFSPKPFSGSIQEFVQQRNASATHPVIPGCEESYFGSPSASTVILYIHGFSACRQEGEMVMNEVASQLGVGVYYVRLPGHGTNIEDFRDTGFQEYLQSVEEAVQFLLSQNKRVVLFGTSMGGTIATYMADLYQADIDALVLVSPFFDFVARSAKLLAIRNGEDIVSAIGFATRHLDVSNPNIYIANYQDYWYNHYSIKAVGHLVDMRNFVLKNVKPQEINLPVLLLYYEKDKKTRDTAASVPAMLKVFKMMENYAPDGLFKRSVRIRDGNHVLLSQYVNSDHEAAAVAITDFLWRVTERNGN